ncbi:MAG: T9SS type A sorting domain-containing protein [Bacteroidota bacterium]
MMKNLLYFLLLISFNQLLAQGYPSCDGLRYRTDVFTDVVSTKGLQYGAGTTIAGDNKELFMDIYEPAGDTASVRPAVVLAFGGSFIFGEREDLDWLCEAFARKGYVAVTIDYRLYDLPLLPLPTGEEMQEVVVKAISDMKAAMRYLVEDANTENLYRVDPDMIFVGGISAGAITAAHVAMLDSTDVISPDLWDLITDNGGLEGNSSDNLAFTRPAKGLVNFSGGLNDASWIDAADPPFVSVHDEFDGIVPYGEGFASIFTVNIIYFEGSQVMEQVADSVGVENELMTIAGSDGHVSYFSNESERESILTFASSFLHDIICGEIILNDEEIMNEQLDNISVYPNPTTGMLLINNKTQLDLKLSLYNSLGQHLQNWENTNSINLGDFQPGIYYLRINNFKSSDKYLMKKIIIER